MEKIDKVYLFTGRTAITIDDEYHEVLSYTKNIKLKKGYGYLKGDTVYIYHGKYEKFGEDELLPGIYKSKSGKAVFVEPETKLDKKKYHISNVVEMKLTVDDIVNTLRQEEENFIDPHEIEVVNNNKERYTPTFHEDDDFLKAAIKHVIEEKKINLKSYRHLFASQHDLNNMKSSLNNKTKMSTTNFKKWEEVLGFKWTLTIEDSGKDKLSPLPHPLTFHSDDF